MPDPTELTRLNQALIELDMRIHSKLGFDEVMQSTLVGFVETLGADAGDIKLFADGIWSVRYEHGFGPEVVGLQLSTAEAPVATRVRQQGTPTVVDDYLTEPPESQVGFPMIYGLRATIAVPLIIRDEVVGCLFAWMRDAPRAFTSEEVDFARRVAASVALALENARLFAAEQEARGCAEAAEQDLERELARTRLLLRASDELLTTVDPDELLERLARIVLDATGLSRVFINLIDIRERVLIPKIATGGLVAPNGARIPFEKLSETARRAIALGKPAILDYELAGTPEADRAIAKANNARVVLFVPFVYQGVVIGHISIDEPGERHDFTAEEIRIVGSIAAQAAVALQNARLALEHAVDVLEQQLRWMAYSLHDGPVQTLSAAGAMLEQAGHSGDPDAVHAQIAAAGGMIDHGLFEMREIMRELRPAELEETSLVAKIREYVEACAARAGTPIGLRVTGQEPRISRPVQVSLFRVVQEALTNAAKHAKAHAVVVSVSFSPAYVECTVTDDGIGFDIDRAMAREATSHWGLASMRERMLMIGGDLEIRTESGKGTEVRACAPLDRAGGVSSERT